MSAQLFNYYFPAVGRPAHFGPRAPQAQFLTAPQPNQYANG